MFPAINVFSVITVFSVIIIFSSDLETDSIGYEESDLLWYIDNETVPPEIVPLMDQLAKVGTQGFSYICKSSHSQLWHHVYKQNKQRGRPFTFHYLIY